MSTPPSGTEGWGKGVWGTSQWGSGITLPPTPPTITPVTPLPDQTGVPQSLPLCISFTDEGQVELASIRITIGNTIYFFSGAPQNGATAQVLVNSGNGFDIEIRTPEKYPLGERLEVTAFCIDNDGEEKEITFFFSVGIGTRLISVSNPTPGVLLAHFNEPMSHDAVFLNSASWEVLPVSVGASAVEITDVFASPTHAGTAVLHHTGGGSLYDLIVSGVVSQSGDPVEDGQNSVVFELLYGAEASPTIRLFDTIFGPVGISQKDLLRRTMDDHVVNRSISVGMDEQFRLRVQNLDGSVGQDGRPGKRRI